MSSTARALVIFTSDLYEGGVAESSRKIIDAFASEDRALHVITYDRLPIKKPISEKISVYEMGIPMSLGFSHGLIEKICRTGWRVIGIWQAQRRLENYLKKIEKPVTLYSLTYFPNLIAMKVTSKLKKQGVDIHLVTSERQDPIKDLVEKQTISARLLLSELRKNYFAADLVHVNSTEMIESVASAYSLPRHKIKLIHNFFDLHYLKQKAREINTVSDDYVLCVGRISDQKGHWHAIELYNQLKLYGYSGKLVILGSGPLKKFVQTRASKLGLTNEVVFINNLDNPYPVIEGADALLFPSLWESFGNVIVEAMALRTLVCASPCKSGPGELILKGDAGLLLGLYPKFDDTDFDSENYKKQIVDDAKKIATTLENPSQLSDLLDAGESRAKNFSTESAVEEFKIIFRLKK